MSAFCLINPQGSEARLWQLIESRTLPGSDKKKIDKRIWDLFGEEWAVMFTDLAGFSRHSAAFGILHFLQIIAESKRLFAPILTDHDGLVLKAVADGMMVLFRKPTSAIRCAVEMQKLCQKANDKRMPEDQILLCVGIGYGKVLRIGDTDVFGTEVNAAAKLGEDIAKANEVLVTGSVKGAAEEITGVQYLDIGVAVAGSELNYRLKYGR